MKKIAIIGPSGAGKSYFAKELGGFLNVNVVHLDNYYWKQNWQKTEAKEWQKIQRKLVEGTEWIIEGNYNDTLELRLEAADTIIFLNFNKLFCLGRVMKRRFSPETDRRGEIGGNRERLTLTLIRSILAYPVAQTMAKIEKFPDKKLFVFKSSHELEIFFAKIRKKLVA